MDDLLRDELLPALALLLRPVDLWSLRPLRRQAAFAVLCPSMLPRLRGFWAAKPENVSEVLRKGPQPSAALLRYVGEQLLIGCHPFASKFPPSLRQKTRELQQSCNRLQHYIATSTSRIQKDVGECIEDLKSIEPSEQQPRRLRRKLSNVEEYLLSVSETLQSQESRAQDLELEIRCLEDDFFGLQKEAEQTTNNYELGVKVFAVCAVVAFAAVALPALAAAGTAAAEGAAVAAGTAAVSEGAVVAAGTAAVAEGAAAAAAGTAAVAEGAAVAAGTAAVAEGAAVAAGTVAAVEGAAVAGISAETVAVLSGGAALALKGGADGCRQLGEFLDRQQQSVSEHRGFVKQLETEIDVMKDDLSNLQKRLSTASDAMDDDDIADASRICDRLAERLGELVHRDDVFCFCSIPFGLGSVKGVSKLLQEATHEQFYIGEDSNAQEEFYIGDEVEAPRLGGLVEDESGDCAIQKLRRRAGASKSPTIDKTQVQPIAAVGSSAVDTFRENAAWAKDQPVPSAPDSSVQAGQTPLVTAEMLYETADLLTTIYFMIW
eukprot:g31710.t1